MSTEIKGVSGIDTAVASIVADIETRKAKLVGDIADLATIVTTDSNIAERKADRASVNKRRGEFDKERKEVEKTWKNAIAPVSDAYKSAVAECDKVIEAIDRGLKEFEDNRIRQKEEEIRTIFEEADKCDVADWLTLEDVYDKRWTNATYKASQIKKDIEDRYSSLSISLSTLKSLGHEWEEEGIKTLRDTGDLQSAIGRMNTLREQAKLIEERKEAEARAKAEAEERAKAEEIRRTQEEAEAKAKTDAEASCEPLPFGEQKEDDAMPFGAPEYVADQKKTMYGIEVFCEEERKEFLVNLLEQYGFRFHEREVYEC